MARIFLSFYLCPPFLKVFLFSPFLGRISFSQALCSIEAIGPPSGIPDNLLSPRLPEVLSLQQLFCERICFSGLSSFAPSFSLMGLSRPWPFKRPPASISIWSGPSGLLWEPDCWIPWDILCSIL